MSTFCAVDDAALISLINAAKQRIVFIAPGMTLPVTSSCIAGANVVFTTCFDASASSCCFEQ